MLKHHIATMRAKNFYHTRDLSNFKTTITAVAQFEGRCKNQQAHEPAPLIDEINEAIEFPSTWSANDHIRRFGIDARRTHVAPY